MISDTFEFVNEVHELLINNGDILVSYDVSTLFTKNVPLEETIQLLATRLSLIIGLMKRTILISISWTLLIFLERQQRANFSRSTASYMNRPTELLWAPPPWSSISQCFYVQHWRNPGALRQDAHVLQEICCQLWTNSALFTNLNVTCAMQVMLVSHAVFYTYMLKNTKTLLHHWQASSQQTFHGSKGSYKEL